jgi:GTPase SAR1 family protein
MPGIGKTTLLTRLCTGELPGEYIPSVWDVTFAWWKFDPLDLNDSKFYHSLNASGYGDDTISQNSADELRQADPERYSFCPVSFWDSDGGYNDDYGRIHVLSYLETHVCFLMFSVDNQGSFDYIRQAKFVEVRHWAPDCALFVVVGLKADLRGGVPEDELVSSADAEAFAREIGAIRYVEVSSVESPKSIERLVEYAVLAAVRPFRTTERDDHDGDANRP